MILKIAAIIWFIGFIIFWIPCAIILIRGYYLDNYVEGDEWEALWLCMVWPAVVVVLVIMFAFLVCKCVQHLGKYLISYRW